MGETSGLEAFDGSNVRIKKRKYNLRKSTRMNSMQSKNRSWTRQHFQEYWYPHSCAFTNFLLDFRKEMLGHSLTRDNFNRMALECWEETPSEDRKFYDEAAQHARERHSSHRKSIKLDQMPIPYKHSMQEPRCKRNIFGKLHRKSNKANIEKCVSLLESNDLRSESSLADSISSCETSRNVNHLSDSKNHDFSDLSSIRSDDESNSCNLSGSASNARTSI